MRFKWRSHLMVTALAAFSILPFTGCSSSQQQSGDEVQASDQDSQGGEDKADTAEASDQQKGGDDTATTQGGGDDTAAQTGTGNEVVQNDAVVQNNAPAAEGDLQEIVQEMGADGTPKNGAPAANPAPAAANAAPAAGGDEQATADNAPAAQPAAAPAGGDAPAAQPAAVGGLPEMGSKMSYIVEAGDTLGKIATRVYGDQKRWKDISGLTGLSDPNHIFPGDLVYYSLDEKSAQFAATYEGLKRNKEVVRQGDTLATIAKRLYGSSKSWRHIWRQNEHIDNPDKLEVGSTIYYVEKDAIKTALNNSKQLKQTNSQKQLKTAAVKVLKATKVVSYLKAQQQAAFAFTV